ncbi:MAG: hypothetical protein WAV21_02965 [Minisyncoccia bacterium]
MKKGIQEFGIPAAAAFLFLAFQADGTMSELSLTAFIVVVTFLIFLLKNHRNEGWILVIGIGFGLLIEIGFRIFGYQQNWNQSSLFGIPYWLPIAWGIGFVLITRLGIVLRRINLRD